MKELKSVFVRVELPDVRCVPVFSVRVDQELTKDDRVFLVLVAGNPPTIEIPFDLPITWDPFAEIEVFGEELVQAAEFAEAMESLIAEKGFLVVYLCKNPSSLAGDFCMSLAFFVGGCYVTINIYEQCLE